VGEREYTWEEADRIWARLAQARDEAGDDDAEAFLARLALILANEVGDVDRVLAAIDAALAARER